MKKQDSLCYSSSIFMYGNAIGYIKCVSYQVFQPKCIVTFTKFSIIHT